jgi:hypothetical protein
MMTQREHVYGLAAANGIKVNEVLSDVADSYANTKTREVFVARLDDDAAYAGALHELGHLIAPGGNLRSGEVRPTNELQAANYTLHEEATAWQWAKATALGWNAVMQRTMERFFSTYEKPVQQMKEVIADRIIAQALPKRPYAKGDAAAFFCASNHGRKAPATRKPTTDLNNTPLTPEAIEFKEFKKMMEALFG